MLGQKKAEELAKRALSLSQAEQTEVLIRTDDTALTRFANNVIHQNVSGSEARVTFRAVVGRQVGAASTNDLRDNGLKKAAERALTNARRQPEDPDFPGLPEPQPIVAVKVFDESTAALSPEARAIAVGVVCTLARERKLNAFGAFRTMTFELAVENSQGLFAYHAGTQADLQTVVMGEDGSGRAQASGWKADEIDAESVGQEAVEKAARAQNPRKVEPGAYTVVIDHYVTHDLLAMLNLHGMSAQAVQEGRSWMNDRLGQTVMSPLVSIWDDGLDPAGAPLPFDYEGAPRQRVQIVEKGVVCGPVYDRYTARREGRQTTGHKIPHDFPFFTGPLALNLFMAGGNSSVEDMIRSTEDGLYITRFWYTRVVHPRDCVVTGMTRDGTFRIERGEVTYPVKNLRFTQSYVRALANVQAVGKETPLLLDEMPGGVRAPALQIEGFHFTGSTV